MTALTEGIALAITVESSAAETSIDSFRDKALNASSGVISLAKAIAILEKTNNSLADALQESIVAANELNNNMKRVAASSAADEIDNLASSVHVLDSASDGLASSLHGSLVAMDSLENEAKSASGSVDSLRASALGASSVVDGYAEKTEHAATATHRLATETDKNSRHATTAASKTSGLKDALESLDRASAGSERTLRSAAGALGTLGNGAAESLGLIGDLAGIISGGGALALAGALAVGTLAVEAFNKQLEKLEKDALAAQAAIDAIRDPTSKILKGSSDATAALRAEIEDLRLLGVSESEDAIQKITNSYARSVDGLREKISNTKKELENIRKSNDALVNRQARGESVGGQIAANAEAFRQRQAAIADLEKAVKIADEEAALKEERLRQETRIQSVYENQRQSRQAALDLVKRENEERSRIAGENNADRAQDLAAVAMRDAQREAELLANFQREQDAKEIAAVEARDAALQSIEEGAQRWRQQQRDDERTRWELGEKAKTKIKQDELNEQARLEEQNAQFIEGIKQQAIMSSISMLQGATQQFIADTIAGNENATENLITNVAIQTGQALVGFGTQMIGQGLVQLGAGNVAGAAFNFATGGGLIATGTAIGGVAMGLQARSAAEAQANAKQEKGVNSSRAVGEKGGDGGVTLVFNYGVGGPRGEDVARELARYQRIQRQGGYA